MKALMTIIIFILSVLASIAFYGLLYIVFKSLISWLGEKTAGSIIGTGFIIFVGISIILGIIFTLIGILS